MNTLDALAEATESYGAALRARSDLERLLGELYAKRDDLHRRTVLDDDLYAQYDLVEVDAQIEELEEHHAQVSYDLDHADAHWADQTERLDSSFRCPVDVQQVRLMHGSRHRRTSGAKPIRRRGSRRVTRPAAPDPTTQTENHPLAAT